MESNPPSDRSPLEFASALFAAVAGLMGLIVLIGWSLDIAELDRVVAGRVPMKANTALCFVLAAGALLARRTRPGSRWRRVSVACAAAVLAIGLATLSEYLFRWKLGIDQLLFTDHVGSGAPYPGRPAFNTAACFLLVGLAVLCWDVHVGRWWPSNVLAITLGLISLGALVGYAAGTQSLTDLAAGQRVALHTAAGLMLLSLALLFACPERGAMGQLTADDPGGVTLRRMLPIAIVVPIGLAWLWRIGDGAGIYDPHRGVWILASSVIVLSIGLSWPLARKLREVDALRLRTSARLAAIVDSSAEAIVGVSPDGLIESWNGSAERLYGYTPDEVLGRRVTMLMTPERADERERMLARVLEGKFVEQLETQDVRKDDTLIEVAITASPIRDDSGKIVGAARIAHDISERKRFEHELEFNADHDALTGLFNRRRFTRELARAVALAGRHTEQRNSLLIADLDDLKYVNDTYGHGVGDELIKGVARAMGGRLRETDLFARIGGDEFSVLLPHTGAGQARVVATSLCEAARAFETNVSGRSVRTTISIGIAPIRTGASATDVLVEADQAMYAAKNLGRNQVATYPGESRDSANPTFGWADRLRDALDGHRFELYAQPIVDISTAQVCRHELLLRMHDEGDEIVMPNAFLPAAERFGLIAEIDRWVVREAIRLLAEDSDATTTYQVNVSAISISDPNLPVLIDREIAAAGIDADRLVFEVTEKAVMRDIDAAQEFMRELQRIGCACALDDFGSHFGSLWHLKRLPADYLKIDGEFARQLPGTEDDRVLIKAIIDVAHGLGKQTIAQHVESEEALSLLRDYGVDYVQGYFTGGPAPIEIHPGATRPA